MFSGSETTDALVALLAGAIGSSSAPNNHPNEDLQFSETKRVLLTGPTGSGKSHAVREALARVSNSVDDAAITVRKVSSADVYAHKYSDGSNGLARYFQQAPPSKTRSGSSGRKPNPFVVVIFDHLELLLHEIAGGSSDGQGDNGGADVVGEGPQASAQYCYDDKLLATVVELLDDLPRNVFFIGMFTEAVVSAGGPSSEDAAGDDGTSLAAGRRLPPLFTRRCIDATIRVGVADTAERVAIISDVWRQTLRPVLESIPESMRSDMEEQLSHASVRVAASAGGLTTGAMVDIVRTAADVVIDLVDQGETNVESDQPASLQEGVKLLEAQVLKRIAVYRQAHPTFGHCEVTTTKWEAIVGLHTVKKQLQELVAAPLRASAAYEHCGVAPSIGVVLHGPPGTGKTMLAKAMATELSASFVYVDLPQLVHAEVGESERVLREFFEVAQSRAPCVMFIDELQAVFGKRDQTTAAGSIRAGKGATGPGSPPGRDANLHESRLVTAFMSMLDLAREGFAKAPIVFIGATNVVEMLDPAVLRPGRLDTHLYVGPPDEESREVLIRRVVQSEWSLEAIPAALVARLVAATDGCTGAELRNTVTAFGMSLLAALDVAPEENGSGLDDSSLVNTFRAALEEEPMGETMKCCLDDVEAVAEARRVASRPAWAVPDDRYSYSGDKRPVAKWRQRPAAESTA